MIAPVRGPPAKSSRPASSLATARRAVAAALFQRTAKNSSQTPHVSNLLAWAFVAWAAAVAISYFALGGWWTIPWY